MCWEESSDTGCFGWCIIRYREYEDQGLCGKIASHSFQCIFFETGDLGLGDADHVGDLGLGLSFEKAQRDDMTLSVVQTFHGFAEGEMFYPHLFLIFFITDLVHDIEGVAAVSVDRLIETHGVLHGI